MTRMLESEEAARRLGVKVATLYAYVSRGLLPSHPAPGGPGGRRRSLFDADDVERLSRRSRGGRTVETRLATVTTAVTQLRDSGPSYRGVPATDLAVTAPYEDVAERLWGTDPGGPGGPDPQSPDARVHRPPWRPVTLGRRPAGLTPSDLVRWAVVLAGAGEPLRADLRPDAVTAAARRLVASMVDVLPPPRRPGGPGPGAAGGRLALPGTSPPDPVAGRLARRLVPAPGDDLVLAVNAAMVLLADHELATSTVAVRVAASTRADLFDAVLAGLGTIAGPLHGGASQLVHALLVDAERHGPERSLDDALRWRGHLPGFGHTVYRDGDPRAAVLLGLFDRLADRRHRELLGAVLDLAAGHGIPAPNVDLGLGAVAWAAGMPADAGRTIFTVARVAGWTAHYLEELEERPLRFRARAVYASPTSTLGP